MGYTPGYVTQRGYLTRTETAIRHAKPKQKPYKLFDERACSFIVVPTFPHVIGATALTGKPYSAKLAPDETQIQALRDRYGQEFEEWWRQRFGFGFTELTRSEARYLENSPGAHTVRDRLIAAGLEDGSATCSDPHAPIAPSDGT